MDLRFVAPSLRRLDLAGAEVLVCCLVQGERPPGGVAGLIDWRFSGKLSRLLLRGFVTGELGEVVLLPGRPKLPFDKLLFFGLGEAKGFDERVYRMTVERILERLAGLNTRRAVVELPGRAGELISAERAAAVLLEITEERPEHDSWTLVESPETQRVIQKLWALDRRRQA
ncbi:MAG: leucyl aminopeptidase [Polyangiaceae bacterium]|nr:leucyl aminopeptidase [Polyangiaceae bacterium]MCW5790323.1 leucyl aminopeptidase [Polyangiaceae bacterium]